MKSLDEKLARLCTSSGLTFRQLADLEIRELLTEIYTEVPDHHECIKEKVVHFAKSVMTTCRDEIADAKLSAKFGLSIEQWISNAERRYLNLHLTHGLKKEWNLGIVRTPGKVYDSHCIQYLEKCFKNFDINIQNDITAIVFDGCYILQSIFSSWASIDRQLCFAHAVRFSICEVIYGFKDYEEHLVADDDCDFCHADENTATFFVLDTPIAKKSFAEECANAILRVAETCDFFQDSNNNAVLQRYVLNEFNVTLHLIGYCPNRWTSLIDMVERFLKLHSCIQKATMELKSDVEFKYADIAELEALLSVLKPLKSAVEAICRPNATLLVADAAFRYILNLFRNNQSPLAQRMYLSLLRNVKQRRTIKSDVLKFLQTKALDTKLHWLLQSKPPSQVQMEKYLEKLTKTSAVHDDEVSVEGESDDDFNSETNFSDYGTLEEAIENYGKVVQNHESSDTLSRKKLKHEIKIFTNEFNRLETLEFAYQSLLSVKPSSIECEQAFMNIGYTYKRFETKFSNETLNQITFLRAYFRK